MIRGVLKTAALIALLPALNEALVVAIGSLTTLVPLPAMQKILVSWCCPDLANRTYQG